MANEILILGSEVTAAPANLALNELAYSHASDTLFIGAPGNTVIAIAGASIFAKLVSPNFTGSPTAPTQVVGDNSTKLATTGFVKNQGYIAGNQNITFTGDVSGSGTTNVNLTLKASGILAGTYTKVTFDAKGIATAGGNLVEADIPALPTSKITGFDTQVRTSRLDQMAKPTTNLDMNGNRVVGAAAAVNANDLVTKSQMEALAQGVSWRDPVDEIATAPSGAEVAGGAGWRVLIQGTGTGAFTGHTNKIATWDGAAWSFVSPAANWNLLNKVDDFQYNYDLDTNAWVQTTGTAVNYSAGNGLALTGTVFDIGQGTGIKVNADDIEIDPAWPGQTALKTFAGVDLTALAVGSMLKVIAGGNLAVAVEGTDYLSSSSTIDGGTF